jgi:hypothetical protein
MAHVIQAEVARQVSLALQSFFAGMGAAKKTWEEPSQPPTPPMLGPGGR